MPSSRPKPDCLNPPNGVCTRTDVFAFTESPRAVSRPDRAGEAVRRVVRDANRISLVVEGDDCGHRSEDLLACDAIVVRRLDERARIPVPGPLGNVSTERRVTVDERRDGLPVRGRHERPHLRRLIGRIADLHALRGLDEEVEEPVVHQALHEDARARAAVLAGVVEDGVRRGGGGLLEIGVLEDYVGRLAAELECDALDRAGRALHDEPSDLRRAGERDLRDVRVLD